MLNNNAFQSSLIFLGMIFLAIIVRMFLIGDSALIQENTTDGFANVTCVFKSTC